MYAQVEKPKENKSHSVQNAVSPKQSGGKSTFQFVDNRPEVIAQRKLQEMANNSPQAKQASQLQAMADNHIAHKHRPFQKKDNNTGLSDNLKTRMENLSGMSLDDVKVHRGSDKPAQLQAHAYAQGTDIHLGPGQEKHLPHEAWHVVQQKQGGVKPTMQMKGNVNINDDSGLEREANLMGAKALLMNSQDKPFSYQLKQETGSRQDTIQFVKAYRVEYSHNRKVIDSDGTVTGLTAPIDISFVLPDHSEYFASERNQEQLKGLRVVEWSMNDDWWAAVQKMHNIGKDKLSGKADNFYKTMKGKLATPTWSDGASLTKFIKQTALHFQKDWGTSLNSAIMPGSGSVRDLEFEYYKNQKENMKDTDLVWAYSEPTEEDRQEEDFDEGEWGPANGFELSKAEAIGFEFMPINYAVSLGHKEED